MGNKYGTLVSMATIPGEVYFNDELTEIEKKIFWIIQGMDKKNGCKVTNEYFQKHCKCSQPTISKSITKLTELGYIKQTVRQKAIILEGRKYPKTERIIFINNEYEAKYKHLIYEYNQIHDDWYDGKMHQNDKEKKK